MPELPSPLALRHFIEYFVQPTPTGYAHLAAAVEVRKTSKNAVLHHAGQICDAGYFLQAGIARHYHG